MKKFIRNNIFVGIIALMGGIIITFPFFVTASFNNRGTIPIKIMQGVPTLGLNSPAQILFTGTCAGALTAFILPPIYNSLIEMSIEGDPASFQGCYVSIVLYDGNIINCDPPTYYYQNIPLELKIKLNNDNQTIECIADISSYR